MTTRRTTTPLAALACAAVLALPALSPMAAAQDGGARARQLRQAGRAEEALQAADEALRRAPQDEDLAALRGMLLLDVGRDADAAALAAAWAAYDGDAFRVHAFLGRQRLLSGDAEGAVAAFRRSLDLKPDAVEASVGLVQALLTARRARGAVRAAESLEALSPELGRRLGAQALLLQGQKMRLVGEEALPRAIPVLRLALEKDSANRGVQETLVETLIDTVRIEEARELIAAHFAAPEDLALRHYLQGRALDVLTDIEGAEAEYLAALEADPDATNALLELARVAIEREDWDAARTWLDRVVASDEASGGGRQLILRGMMEDGLGHASVARRAYERALEVSPENGKARYLLGRMLVREGDVERGMELLAVMTADDDL